MEIIIIIITAVMAAVAMEITAATAAGIITMDSLIMAFVLVSLIVLFIMSMVSNRFSQMSTQEISYSQFLEKVEAGEVKSVEIGSYEIDYNTGDKGQESVPADLLLRTRGG